MPPNYFDEEEFEAKYTGKTLRRIIGLLRPHWKYVAIFLSMIVVVSSAGCAVHLHQSNRSSTRALSAQRSAHVLYRYWLLYGGLTVGQALFVFGFIYTVGLLGERIRYDLRQKMFNHLQDLSLSYYSKTPVGWIMARVTSDSDRVSDLLTWGLLDITWAVVNIITSMGFMLYINWRLALIVMLMVPILMVVAIEFRKRILKQFRNVRKINSKITGQYNESITGVRVVKALVREDENAVEFGVLTSEMYQAAYRAAWLSALFLPSVQIIAAVALGAIVWYGGWQAQFGGADHRRDPGFRLVCDVHDVADPGSGAHLRGHAARDRLRGADFLADRFGAGGGQPPDAIDPGTIQGDIEFEHVTFYYDDDTPVLKDFSLTVKRGRDHRAGGADRAAANRPSSTWSAASTSRRKARSASAERITRDFTLHAIQSRIGVVLQTPHLFSGTIRENIRYGRLDATDEEIEEAAKLAGAHDFITKFEKGYDEPVGEGGNTAFGRAEAVDQPDARRSWRNRRSSSWMRRPARWTR